MLHPILYICQICGTGFTKLVQGLFITGALDAVICKACLKRLPLEGKKFETK